ncbi:hypothetical protein MC885_008323 [Smutsia gigantea]
MLQSS